MTARSPGPSYQDLLDADTQKVPAFLREQSLRTEGGPDFGLADIPARFYLDRDLVALEKERIWKTVWQFACRETAVANPGDTVVYDIADLSILIVRGEDGVLRAIYNACLHRGRQLRQEDGPANELACQFHGFCWNLQGELARVPARWDFPHVTDDAFVLPQVRIDTWGGFVFVCLSSDQVPLL